MMNVSRRSTRRAVAPRTYLRHRHEFAQDHGPSLAAVYTWPQDAPTSRGLGAHSGRVWGAWPHAMESTGVFWKPIFNILEATFELLLVNARHITQVPGRKTDVKDCQLIAQFLQHGLLQGRSWLTYWSEVHQ